MPIVDNPEMTPREHMQMEWTKEENERSREHAIVIKKLELELTREKNAAEIKLKELEAKWSSWLRLPSLIIKLPLLVLLGLGYVIDSIKGNDPSSNFWKHIR